MIKLKCAVCGKSLKHDELFVIRDKYTCETCGSEEKSEREVTLQELIWQIEYRGYCILPKLEEECEACERECITKTLLEKIYDLEEKVEKLEKKTEEL